MSAAAEQPSRGARLRRMLAIVLVFNVVFPPAGMVVYSMAVVLVGLVTGADLPGLRWIALLVFIYAMPFVYLAGFIPATVAGLAIGFHQSFRGRIAWSSVLMCGAAVAGGYLLAYARGIVAPDDTDPGYVPFMTVALLGGTFVCWLIVRSWYFDAPPSANTSP